MLLGLVPPDVFFEMACVGVEKIPTSYPLNEPVLCRSTGEQAGAQQVFEQQVFSTQSLHQVF
jgi:hypothetical protein